MCELCDNTPENEPLPSCQDCGRLICYDTEQDDDICARAYVTASGDLYCRICGRRYDEEEESVTDMEDRYWQEEAEAIIE